MRRYLTTRRGQGREDSGELPSLVRNVPLFASSQNVVGKTIECQLGGEWTNGWKVRLADTFQPLYHSQRRANKFASPNGRLRSILLPRCKGEQVHHEDAEQSGK
jgi:hypothetical protein